MDNEIFCNVCNDNIDKEERESKFICNDLNQLIQIIYCSSLNLYLIICLLSITLSSPNASTRAFRSNS